MSLLPIAAGAGLLALLALGGGKSGGATAPSSAPSSPTPGGSAPAAGPGPMPPALKAQFDDLLSNGINADGLEAVASELDKFGFTNEANTLRARAQQIRLAQAAQGTQPKAAPPPFVPGTQFVPGVTDGNQGPNPLPNTLQVPATPLTPALSIPIPVVPPPPPVAQIQQARVTTNDAPPSGDLVMRVAPDPSAAQVPGGGAEKDGTVTVVNPNASADGIWAEIIWAGGSRRPPARGFAKKAFLTMLPPSPTVSGVVVGAAGLNYAKCVAPSGCRLRVAPSTQATFRALVGNGETVRVLLHAKGDKAEYGSPGPGGWAKVQYKNLQGWLPSEWLQAA